MINYPVQMSFEDFLRRLEVKMAKVIHVRDDHEELVSFKPQYVLPRSLNWLRKYSVVEARFDSETEELFIKIV